MKTNNISQSGKIGWRSPSNIALIKYWGKTENQIPANTSLSFTLSNAHTSTVIEYSAISADGNFHLEVWLNGNKEPSFEPKIITFFKRIEKEFPFLKDYQFKIETSNSFPHSSGIASSASGFSALALCLCSIEEILKGPIDNFFQKASAISRLGSGSACRSLFGGLVLWGKHNDISYSNNHYAEALQSSIHPVFKTFKDTILLVEKGKKEVSSTVGHSLMDNNPFAEKRFEVAQRQISNILKTIEEGDVEKFGKIVEQEALMLHAMMMTSDPYFLLFKANTVNIIQKVWEKRNQNGLKLYITLDAGANVHLLYPESAEAEVLKFIDNELIGYCENKQYICDQVGEGPTKLELT